MKIRAKSSSDSFKGMKNRLFSTFLTTCLQSTVDICTAEIDLRKEAENCDSWVTKMLHSVLEIALDFLGEWDQLLWKIVLKIIIISMKMETE